MSAGSASGCKATVLVYKIRRGVERRSYEGGRA